MVQITSYNIKHALGGIVPEFVDQHVQTSSELRLE